MTKNEVFKTLNSILLDNDFWLSEIDECREKNAELIENINSIFKLEKPMDFTLLLAAIELLCKNPEPVMDYFLKDNKTSLPIVKPKRNDLLTIVTVFRVNPIFFSKCWNLVAFIEHEITESSNKNNTNIIHIDFDRNQIVTLDYPVYASAAGSPGFNNITRIPINLLGELEIRGNSETEEVVFVLSINKEYQTFKFEITIEFEANNSMYSAIIEKKDSAEDEEIRSEPVQVDFTKGLKLKKINWKVL